MSARWVVEQRTASVHALHHDEIRVPGPWVRVCLPRDAALVLGSTQTDRVVDPSAVAAADLPVVRRRSGGGAVLVRPGEQVWLDCWVPAGDPLWEVDVARAFGWLGAVWVDALESLGVTAAVHRGRLEADRWGRLVCFGGRGPGEVLVGGRKVVGIAQHRSRAGARFHASALLAWEPAALLELLALTPAERDAAQRVLGERAAPLELDPAALTRAVVDRLP